METTILKLVTAVIALLVAFKFVQPILMPIYPPFGELAMVLIYVVTLLWLIR